MSDSEDNILADDYEERKKRKRKTPKPPEDFGIVDLRVGRITRSETNPFSLVNSYIHNIEIGEEVTRLCVSDLPTRYIEEQLRRRLVVVVCNLRPKKKRGIISEVWLLVGRKDGKVELLDPPEECEEGDQITVEGYPGIPDLRKEQEPATAAMRRIFKDLRINGEKVATYRGIPLKVEGKQEICVETLTDCPITDTVESFT